jgi:hypothetical protein
MNPTTKGGQLLGCIGKVVWAGGTLHNEVRSGGGLQCSGVRIFHPLYAVFSSNFLARLVVSADVTYSPRGPFRVFSAV